MAKEIEKIVNEYNDILDMPFINQVIEQSGKLDDFQMNKTTLLNVAEWALNGNSNEEIRKKLELTPNQWQVLVSICPTLLLVMRDSRALADVIIAGSLFQTAIGGKKVRKQVAKSVTDYENGKPCGQHLETIELWEELPPNPNLLIFLAKNKLSEQFGEDKGQVKEDYKDILNQLTPEQIAMIEMASKGKGILEDEEDK